MSIGSCRPIFHPLTVLGTEGTLVDGLLLKTSKRSQVVYYPDKALSPRQRILGRWAMMDGRAIRFPYDHNEHDRACKDLIRDFLDAVLNDTSVPISVEDSIDVIRVCESLVMSYQTGLPVKVERRDESPKRVVKFAGVGAGHWAG